MHYKNRSQGNILRKKRTSRAPNLYSYRDKNKDKYYTKKFPRNAANQRKIPSFKSDDDPQDLSLLLLKRPKECPIIKCYSNRCAQHAESSHCIRAVLDCRFSTRLDRQILGGFRLDYEYEIKYEYDFSILVFRLHILHNTYPIHPMSHSLYLKST